MVVVNNCGSAMIEAAGFILPSKLLDDLPDRDDTIDTLSDIALVLRGSEYDNPEMSRPATAKLQTTVDEHTRELAAARRLSRLHNVLRQIMPPA